MLFLLFDWFYHLLILIFYIKDYDNSILCDCCWTFNLVMSLLEIIMFKRCHFGVDIVTFMGFVM